MKEPIRKKALEKLQDLGFDIGGIESGRTLENFLENVRECPDEKYNGNPYLSILHNELGIRDHFPFFMDIPKSRFSEMLKILEERYGKRGDYLLIPSSSESPYQKEPFLIAIGKLSTDPGTIADDFSPASTDPTHRNLECLFSSVIVLGHDLVDGRRNSYIGDRAIATLLLDIGHYALDKSIPLTLHSVTGNHQVPNPNYDPNHFGGSSLQIPDYSRIVYYLPKSK